MAEQEEKKSGMSNTTIALVTIGIIFTFILFVGGMVIFYYMSKSKNDDE